MSKRRKRRQKKQQQLAEKRDVSSASSSENTISSKKKSYKGLIGFYESQYKVLLIIPFAILLIAMIILASNVVRTGSLVETDVSLSGGITLTVPTASNPVSLTQVESVLTQNLNEDFLVREIADFGQQQAITIQVAASTEDTVSIERSVVDALEPIIPSIRDTYAVEVIGPALGKAFLHQTVVALIAAFVLMALVVFYYFRTFVPSFAVVLAAFSDIVVTLAVVSVLDMKISTAGIAAFLMLIGYSVDTDILLSTRVIKRKSGSVFERVLSAVKTGFIMNATTLAAILSALLITQSAIIAQIMTILLIGLIVDMINTWIQNVGILRWYMEGRQ